MSELVDPGAVAVVLDAAHREGRTLDVADIAVGDLRSAYAVQDALTSLRLSRGDSVVGWKLGYTTRAMRDQMGIDAPNLGPLLASMRVEDGARVSGIHPRVEPEIAFVMGEDPGSAPTPDDVLRAVSEVRLALEVVDSVWWGYRFDLEHNTADGSSAHGFRLGPLLPAGLDRVDVRLTAYPSGLDETDGRLWDELAERREGSGQVVDAAESTAWLCRELADRGLRLRPGDVVLTGGLTQALPLGLGAEAQVVGTEVRVSV